MILSDKKDLIKILCNVDDINVVHEECKGALNATCAERGYCCIDSLSDQQLDYIFSELDEDVYLNACPGSGKTEVIGIKVAYEMKQWESLNRGIAVLTFTNSAEDEILERVSLYCNKPVEYPHFIGTFTSWLHGYIANPYLYSYISDKERADNSINLFDPNSYNQIALNYCTKYSYGSLNKINPTQYYESAYHDRIIFTSNRGKQDELDELLKKNKWRTKELLGRKRKFNEANLYTYEDVEQLVFKLLDENPELVDLVVERFPMIFIDECQDLSMIQIWILELIRSAGTCIHIIGDLDQSIYEFRLVNPNETRNYISNNKYSEMKLTQNYRSCQAIVDVSGQIIVRKHQVTGMQKQKCCESLRVIFYERGKEQSAVEKYKELLEEESINVENSYIIVRNNTLKKKITGDKSNKENALEAMAKAIYYFRSYTSLNDYTEMFSYAGKAINRIFFKDHSGGNKGNFHCPEDFRIDKWRTLIYNLLQSISSNKNLVFSITWSEWKKELAKELAIIQDKYDVLSECTCELGRMRNNMGKVQVSDMFADTSDYNNSINITTIHGAKGMSLDSTLVFSSYQKSKNESGAFWKMWFDISEVTEKNRLAYVSFSRAKHLLVLAIPRAKRSKDSDFDELFNHGFVDYK